MVRVIFLVSLALLYTFASAQTAPCAYWCEAQCQPKTPSFYCCSFSPSLAGPGSLLPPPCKSLCESRPGNDLATARNCRLEIDNLLAIGKFKYCKNFNDCDPALHDLCCTDNCLPDPAKKMCI